MISKISMLRPLLKPYLIQASMILLLLIPPSLLAGQLHTYVDADGNLHITDFWTESYSRPVPAACISPSLKNLIHKESKKKGLDPRLVEAVIRVESNYDPRALSPSGAIGLMQLMPDAAKLYGVYNLWDVKQNIEAGTSYLRDLLFHFNGDVVKALAAYNAGPRAVHEYGGIPPFYETKRYVNKILAIYPIRHTRVANLQGQGSKHRPLRRIKLPDGTILYTNLPE